MVRSVPLRRPTTPTPLSFSPPPRVYLTGFMASGKSTVGPLVADALGHRFVDLDWLVEARAGQSVEALFAAGGEAAFRAAEAAALAETTRGDGVVVATGGGALVDPANLELARRAGVVVWLRTTPDVVLARLGSAAGRPLLADADGFPLCGDHLRGRVEGLMAARAPLYARADLTVDADADAPAVASAVVAALRHS